MDNSSDKFYRAFEDRYRGSRELVKSRLAVYLPFVAPLKEFYGECDAVDLGCGRGEWLELAAELGINVIGVELDEGMLDISRELDLPVIKEDAITYLKGQKNDSLAVVSAFHVVEHIHFSDLQTLVREALRALKPGGLLILETPNPENIVVGSSKFYLDPTHQRPIPPELLTFLPEYYGFDRTKVLRVQEDPEIAKGRAPELLDVLNGVSPDYGVVAQKSGDPHLIAVMTPTFEKEYGLSLEAISQGYEGQMVARIKVAEDDAVDAKIFAGDALSRAADSAIQAAESEARAIQAEAYIRLAEDHMAKAEAQIRDAEARINDLLLSTSWRVTGPLRWISTAFRRSLAWTVGIPRHLKTLIKKLLTHLAIYIRCHPRLRRYLHGLMDRFPRLKQRLIAFIIGSAAQSNASVSFPRHAVADVRDLTPRARRIYADLKAILQQERKAG